MAVKTQEMKGIDAVLAFHDEEPNGTRATMTIIFERYEVPLMNFYDTEERAKKAIANGLRDKCGELFSKDTDERGCYTIWKEEEKPARKPVAPVQFSPAPEANRDEKRRAMVIADKTPQVAPAPHDPIQAIDEVAVVVHPTSISNPTLTPREQVRMLLAKAVEILETGNATQEVSYASGRDGLTLRVVWPKDDA